MLLPPAAVFERKASAMSARVEANPYNTAVAAVVHPLIVRLTHWVNAGAMIVMIMSGWQIHNAYPTLPFSFPGMLTLTRRLQHRTASAIGKRTATIGSAVYDVLPGPGGRVRRAFAAVHFVRGWHKADIPRVSSNVCFWG